MKTRFTLLFLLVTGLAFSQTPTRPKWKIPETVAQRLVVVPTRLYVGFDMGYYHNSRSGSEMGGRILNAFRFNRELVPGLTLGWHLNRRVSLETGIYNLPSTLDYKVEIHPTSSELGGLGIQYAMIPLRLRYRIWQPTRWLTANAQIGVALAFNNKIQKGRFERFNAVYPPVWGDTMQVTDNAVMIHNFSPLLEAGLELNARLNTHLSFILYGRGLVGLQTLWRNEITYQINQEAPRQTSLSARAGGYTLGLGLRFTFKTGKRYRTVWD
ncbi:MAG: hypothetical protein LH606_15745 [Cytophagaceae bacterium]|nr:hypothetical protein [Cytophagaceae bacterium]